MHRKAVTVSRHVTPRDRFVSCSFTHCERYNVDSVIPASSEWIVGSCHQRQRSLLLARNLPTATLNEWAGAE